MIDHAEKWNQERDARARAMVVETAPARWKVMLLIPVIFLTVWAVLATLLSGNPLWVVEFFK